jgi:hypothetical protein
MVTILTFLSIIAEQVFGSKAPDFTLYSVPKERDAIHGTYELAFRPATNLPHETTQNWP